MRRIPRSRTQERQAENARRKQSRTDQRRAENRLGQWAELGLPVLEQGAALECHTPPPMQQLFIRAGVVGDTTLAVRIGPGYMPRLHALAATRGATVAEIAWGAAVLGAQISAGARPRSDVQSQ